MEHRGGQLGHLNGPMALPAVSLPLGDMPMEALDAALAGLAAADPHHELALDQAVMDLHDNDEVLANLKTCTLQLNCSLTRHVALSLWFPFSTQRATHPSLLWPHCWLPCLYVGTAVHFIKSRRRECLSKVVCETHISLFTLLSATSAQQRWARQVRAGELEQVVSGASEGSGGQLARTSSHYMGPVASDSLAHTWMHHTWADAGHVLNRCFN